MHNSNVETKREYVAKFFKEKSKGISKVFSSKTIKISTIRSRSIGSDTQEFSFELKLLTAVGANTIAFQVKRLINFF